MVRQAIAGSTDSRTVRFVSPDDLRFDPDNPRLPRSLAGATEEAVLRWMLEDATLLELMGSIAEQGYFPGEPLLGCPWEPGTQGPPFRVVEGNRRLAAVRLLLDPKRAPTRRASIAQLSSEARHRPDELPMLVFSTRDEILDYLGYRHVTGVKEWDPLAKARYLDQLWRKTKGRARLEKLRELAKRIGSRPDYVSRLLLGLVVYDRIVEEAFFGLKAMEEEDVAFSDERAVALRSDLSEDAFGAGTGIGGEAEPVGV
jgi:hypothetical protein